MLALDARLMLGRLRTLSWARDVEKLPNATAEKRGHLLPNVTAEKRGHLLPDVVAKGVALLLLSFVVFTDHTFFLEAGVPKPYDHTPPTNDP